MNNLKRSTVLDALLQKKTHRTPPLLLLLLLLVPTPTTYFPTSFHQKRADGVFFFLFFFFFVFYIYIFFSNSVPLRIIPGPNLMPPDPWPVFGGLCRRAVKADAWAVSALVVFVVQALVAFATVSAAALWFLLLMKRRGGSRSAGGWRRWRWRVSSGLVVIIVPVRRVRGRAWGSRIPLSPV